MWGWFVAFGVGLSALWGLHNFLSPASAVGEVRRCPAGFAPLQSFTLCPPGGALLELCCIVASYVNDAVQVSLFLDSSDQFPGYLCGTAWVFAVLATFYILYAYESTPLYILREALAHGYATLAWQEFRASWATIEAPVFSLVAPYAMLQNSEIGPWAAASASLCFLTASVGVAISSVASFRGDAREEAAKALRPKLQRAIFAWCFVGVISELATFAMLSIVFHPFIIVMCYIPSAVVNMILMDVRMWLVVSLLQTPYLCFGGLGSILDIEARGKVPHALPRSILLTTLLRYTIFISALYVLELPDGIMPLWNLGRPMGHEVFLHEVVEPAVAALRAVPSGIAAVLLDLVSPGAGAVSTPELVQVGAFELQIKPRLPAFGSTSHVTAGASSFRAVIWAVWLVATPIYLFGTAYIAFRRNSYTEEGLAGEAFSERLRRKQEAIIGWGEARATIVGFDAVPLGSDIYIGSHSAE